MARSALPATFRWRSILDWIFPPRCGGCDAPGSLWCADCQAELRPVTPPLCAKCGQPNTPSGLCANCRASPLVIDSIRSVALFDGHLRHAIHALKYRRMAALAEPLGDALAQFWMLSPAPASLLVPVPLHPRRARERGYNQAALLAERLGRAIGVPARPHALARVRATAVQMSLNAAERKTNVADAFRCADPAVRGADVLLIDDVCTTGATLDACAAALLSGGARAVRGLTLARTP
jgi:ComF family protein